MWLADLHDRIAEQLDLADGATLAIPRASLEAMRDGLARCVEHLDGLTVDPARLPPPDGAPTRRSSQSAPLPVIPSTRVLQ